MKLIFMGTPDFAVPSLLTLIGSGHRSLQQLQVLIRKRGRGQKISYTPVKEAAIENKIPLIQQENFEKI